MRLRELRAIGRNLMLVAVLVALGFVASAINTPPAHAVQYYLCTYANPNNLGTSAGFTLSGVGTFYDGGRAPVNINQYYTLTASPTPSGYAFSSWTTDEGSHPNSVHVTSTTSSSTTVYFTGGTWDGWCLGGLAVNYVVSIQYYLCTYANPNNLGTSAGFTLSGAGTFYDGGRAAVNLQSYTLTASPTPSGYMFSSWTTDEGSHPNSVHVTSPTSSPTTVSFTGNTWDGWCLGGLAVNYVTSSYTYTFYESGLPGGVQWGFTLGGSHYYTTSTYYTLGSLSGSYSYTYDTPVSGYSCYSGCSGTISSAGSHTGYYQTQQYTITVNTSPGGLDSPSGGGSYSSGTWITISVNTVGGYTFQYWNRDGSLYTYGQSFSYQVDAAHTFTAVFQAIPQYTITVNTSPGGLDSPSGGGTYYQNTGITISVNSVSNYAFQYWNRDGSLYSYSQSFGYTVDAAHTFTAVFLPAYTITVNTSPGGLDSPSGGGAYTSGTGITISVGAATGYAFQYWNRDGSLYSYSQSFGYTVDAAHTFTAVFQAVPQYTITVNTSPSSLDSPSGGGTYYQNTGITISVGAASGYAFQYWNRDGTLYSSSQSFGYTVDAAHTFTAVFLPAYTITVNTSPSGLDSPSGGGAYTSGTGITISVGAATGYAFQCWNRDGTLYSSSQSFSYTVDAAHTFTAVFTPTYSVTFQESGLPGGATWGVTVGGTRYTTSSASYVASGLVGTVNYSYDSMVGAYSCTSGCSGSFSAAGSTTGYYTLSMYAGTFRQTGIPAGITWGVTVGGTHYASTGSNVTVPGLGGTVAYSYDTPVSGTAGTRYSCSGCSGSVSGSTPVTVNYAAQYQLTMLSNPSGGGSTAPPTGNWYNATTLITLMTATAAQGYAFTSWSGSGLGSYTGASNPCMNCVTMNGPVTETANFVSQVVMSVSYTVVGDGSGYSPPSFSYVQGGSSKLYPLTETATDMSCDEGSSWTVAPNPLSGSSTSEQWVSGQALSGTVSAQTVVFSFQHQYLLTTQATPPAGGTAAPATGWQNAGANVGISFTENSGYAFQSWTGSGSGSYSGTDNQATVTMNAPITETGNSVQVASLVVSYAVVGGGTPGAPIISYIQGGVSKQYILTQTPKTVLADPDSAWSVLPNPLSGSGTDEQWISNQTLSGTASGQTIVFSFQHQYTLTVSATPVGSGTTIPSGTTWQDAGSTVIITATASGEYSVSAWTINGQQVQGENNQLPVLMSDPRIVVALFSLGGFCPYVSSNPPELSPQPTLSPHCPINPGTVVTVTAPSVVNWKLANFTIIGTTHTEHANQATFNMPTGDVSVVANYEYVGSDAPGAGGGVTVPAYNTPMLMIAALLMVCTIAVARYTPRRTSKRGD